MRLLAEADGNVTVASSLSTKIVLQCEAAFSRTSNLSATGRNWQRRQRSNDAANVGLSMPVFVCLLFFTLLRDTCGGDALRRGH